MATVDDRTFFASGVSKLAKLLPKLAKSIPLATAEDRINTVFKNIPSDTSEPWEVFNRRFDALFGQDTCNANGRLKNIQRGPLGMDMVLEYLQLVTEQEAILWTAAKPKIERLVSEVEHLMSVHTFKQTDHVHTKFYRVHPLKLKITLPRHQGKKTDNSFAFDRIMLYQL